MGTYRTWLLVAIFFIYAVFSESTPDDPGLPEAILGGLLILLVGVTGALRAIGSELVETRPSVPRYAVVAFVWLLVAPTAVLLVRGNDFGDFVRDIIPLMYLLLPVLVIGHLREAPEKAVRLIQRGLSFVGLAYAIRFFNTSEGELFQTTLLGGIEYFTMDPAVIFGATFLLCVGLHLFSQRRLVASAAALLAGGITFGSILASTARGQIALVLCGVALFAWLQIWKRPLRLRSWLPVMLAAAAFLYFDLMWLVEFAVDTVTAKTESAGITNTRDIEVKEILAYAGSGVDVFFFGGGWGHKLFLTTIGVEARFAHNVFFYLLWKTGALGLIAFLAICWWIFKAFIGMWRRRSDPWVMALWLASFNVLVIHGNLEPGYKMLPFGFVLCLILLCGSKGIGQRDNNEYADARTKR